MARDHQQQLPRRCRRYQRLRSGELCDDEDQVLARARRGGPLRLRRKKKAVLSFRMAAAAPRRRVARLLMRLVLLAPARRAAALLAELVRRIATAAVMAAECPAAAGIVFSSQWGLPVLSHSPSSSGSSRTARLRSFYLDRSLSSGSGSPC